MNPQPARERHADSFRQDLHPDLKADFVPVRKDLANPPFNLSDSPIPTGLHPAAQGCRGPRPDWPREATLGNVIHYFPQPQRGNGIQPRVGLSRTGEELPWETVPTIQQP